MKNRNVIAALRRVGELAEHFADEYGMDTNGVPTSPELRGLLDAVGVVIDEAGRTTLPNGGPPRAPRAGMCMYCGCTEEAACVVNEGTDATCSWHNNDQTVCSNPPCVAKHRVAGKRRKGRGR
jgi:hypothetical protein